MKTLYLVEVEHEENALVMVGAMGGEVISALFVKKIPGFRFMNEPGYALAATVDGCYTPKEGDYESQETYLSKGRQKA